MYMPNGFQQDQQGLMPTFQNIGQQQANQNAALQEQAQQVQQAGMTQKGQQLGGDASQVALAKALRNSDLYKKGQAQVGMAQYGSGNVYGYGGQGQVPTSPDFSVDSF